MAYHVINCTKIKLDFAGSLNFPVTESRLEVSLWHDPYLHSNPLLSLSFDFKLSISKSFLRSCLSSREEWEEEKCSKPLSKQTQNNWLPIEILKQYFLPQPPSQIIHFGLLEICAFFAGDFA